MVRSDASAFLNYAVQGSSPGGLSGFQELGISIDKKLLYTGLSQTPTASAIVAALVGQPVELVRPLMESLEYDLLPRDRDAERIFRVRPHRFNRAVEHALREWEATEELVAR